MLDLAATRCVDTPPIVEPEAREHQRCGSHSEPRSDWAVVQTQPQAERWATENLTRQGYPTYLPTFLAQVRDRVTRSLWHTVERPLFTSYVFVVPGSHWGPIAHTLGVRRLLLSGGKPHLLDAACWSALQAGQEARRTSPTRQGEQWLPGQACRLCEGPFTGHEAVVVTMHRTRATVALLAFGALRHVSVGVSCLMPRDIV